MAEIIQPNDAQKLIRIEPADRLVILARTIQDKDDLAASALKESVCNWDRFGETCLGQSLYQHRSVFQGESTAPVWGHFELSYFRDFVPANAIDELVIKEQPAGLDLLRAEILLTTPGSFIIPRDWQGSSERPELQASLEYIEVHPPYLSEYSDVMRNYCGLAATKLVHTKKVGAFRAMETAAVLYRDPAFKVEWNQIHLCEVNAEGFSGFGQAFAEALRDDPPDGADITEVFADLDRIRTVSRWTFNDPVEEGDASIGRAGYGN